MKAIGQGPHGTSDQRCVIGLKQPRFRVEGGPEAAVLLFIERIVERLEAVAAPPRAGICERCEGTRRGRLRR